MPVSCICCRLVSQLSPSYLLFFDALPAPNWRVPWPWSKTWVVPVSLAKFMNNWAFYRTINSGPHVGHMRGPASGDSVRAGTTRSDQVDGAPEEWEVSLLFAWAWIPRNEIRRLRHSHRTHCTRYICLLPEIRAHKKDVPKILFISR